MRDSQIPSDLTVTARARGESTRAHTTQRNLQKTLLDHQVWRRYARAFLSRAVTPTLYEFKCYAFAFLRRALGRGSARGGGAPSTAEGHIVAFGGTEEDLIAKNLGLEQLGTRGEPARDRSTGSVRLRRQA